MMSLLLLGFLLGLRHAMEVDHVAAVAALVTRKHSLGDALRQGAVWGLGHTVTLFVVGSVVLVLDTSMPDRIAHALEFMVGLMLIGLGVDVLRRMHRDRVHFHVHSHTDGVTHFHAHTHNGTESHNRAHHEHTHARVFPLRALLVGLMHGMAGSAALILLTLQTVQSPMAGLLYIGLFGIGSLAGMAVLSVAIALPLRYSPKGLTWLHNGMQTSVGLVTLGLGFALIYETAPALVV